MSAAEDGFEHTEVMEIRATPAQVQAFVMVPERILDYYPQPVDGGVLEPGRAIWCRGESGVSMLERIESECTDSCVVVKVTTAIGLEAPFTRERIEEHATFTMIEDWAVAASASGTTLTKTWRELRSIGESPFSLADAVLQGAVHERDPLIKGWSAAAQTST